MQPPLTKREYFAAHAPKIPEWFKPVMPEKPKADEPFFMKFGSASTHPLKEYTLKYYDVENDVWLDGDSPDKNREDILKLKENVSIHDDNWKNTGSRILKWEERERIERFTQWRWYYADLMIEASPIDKVTRPLHVKLTDLVTTALCSAGESQKQWFLVRVAEMCGLEIFCKHEPGTPPVNHK